jgi:hypothetical protein
MMFRADLRTDSDCFPAVSDNSRAERSKHHIGTHALLLGENISSCFCARQGRNNQVFFTVFTGSYLYFIRIVPSRILFRDS